MLHQAEIKLGYTPSCMHKLGIVHGVGKFLGKVFERTIYLHEGYRIYVTGCRLNNYTDVGLYGSSVIRSYVRLDFLDFLFFFLNLLKEREGKIQLQVTGKFRLATPSENIDISVIEGTAEPLTPLADLQIEFPALSKRNHVKLQAEFFGTDPKWSFDDSWAELQKDLGRCYSHRPFEGAKGKWCNLKPAEVSYLFKAMRNYSLRELFKVITEVSPVRNNGVFGRCGHTQI